MQQYIYVSLDMYTLHQLASFARDIFLLTSASMRRIPREESGNRSGTRDLREVTMDLIGKPWENHEETMGKPWENGGYALWLCQIAIENGRNRGIYPLNMVIFHSYVSLPEGI